MSKGVLPANKFDTYLMTSSLSAPVWLDFLQTGVSVLVAVFGLVLLYHRIKIAKKKSRLLDRELENDTYNNRTRL